MPTVISSYSERMRPAVVGMQADTRQATFISRNVEAAGGLAIGVAVARGSDDKGCLTFGVGHTLTKFLGFCARERSLTAEQSKFLQYESARIQTEGSIWLITAGAVVAGNPVYVDPATGGLDDQQNTGSTRIDTGWRWDTSTSSAALAVAVK